MAIQQIEGIQGDFSVVGDIEVYSYVLNNFPTRKPHFVDTAGGTFTGESFSLVVIAEWNLKACEFFYPRLVRGGYFIIHDPDSSALKFMADKSEMLVEIPDYFGTSLFRKI